ncbi:YusW family protein [Bacillus changyiensis]|uniref:YusW family protein n=1 Tax=Bacillus changyiensis TaxID=3004103 RepID=UPI0022DEEAE6|nr:YusW family protein [Bacillus changyiensis]MDA1476365.1 YusW family protein [Bacillus changyiensis]
MNLLKITCFAILIILTGCQTAVEKPSERQNEDTPVTDIKAVPFAEFTLKVNYGNGKHNTFKAKYHKQEGEVAEIEDQLNDVNREGEEALHEMKMILSELSIAKSDADRTVIRHVLEAFNLDDGYDQFQLQVKWPDGTSRVCTGKE